VILDEIQSYDNNLWWYMVEFFNVFSKLLNLKIIIMSATLPKIDRLLEKKEEFLELIDSKKYFKHPLFKDRVKVDFSMLDEEVDFEKLKKKIVTSNRVLIEFIKKKRAREFYNYIKNLEDYEVYELSGDDNKLLREKVIARTKKATKIIIVSTQVIEAGVDIDMDLGLKDISTFDSDEQFLGRINRNALREGKVYFFDLDKEEYVYRGDNRLGISLKDKKIRKYFLEKEFEKCYEEVLKRLENKKDKFFGSKTQKEEFFELIKRLKYKEIYQKMRLINQVGITIFLPFKLKVDEKFDKKFIKDGFLDGELVWKRLKELNSIENFAKREIEKSRINFYMQFFTFNVPYVRNISEYSDECCGIYLIRDYEEFIDEEFKFDRYKFMESLKREWDFV